MNPFQVSHRDILPDLLRKLLEGRLAKLEKSNMSQEKSMKETMGMIIMTESIVVKCMQGLVKRRTTRAMTTLVKNKSHIKQKVLSKSIDKGNGNYNTSTYTTHTTNSTSRGKVYNNKNKNTGNTTTIKSMTFYNQASTLATSRNLTPTLTPRTPTKYPKTHLRIINKDNSSNHKIIVVSGNKGRNLQQMHHSKATSKFLSTSQDNLSCISASNNPKKKREMHKNFSGEIGQVSNTNDELLTAINTDPFTRNSILPMSVLFPFHLLFDQKYTLLQFLSKQDLMNFSLINHSYGSIFIQEFINQLTEDIMRYEQEILRIKAKKKEVNSHVSISFSNKSIKAAELLDEESYLEIFNTKKPPPNDSVAFIYYLLMTMFNQTNGIEEIKLAYLNKMHLVNYWNKLSMYIIDNAKNHFGSFIMKELNQFDYQQEHLKIIKEVARVNYSMVNPSSYTKICPTTALVTFIVKDFLDFFCISNEVMLLKEKMRKYREMITRITSLKSIIYK